MSHIRMTRSQLFAIEMVRLALEQPVVTSVDGFSSNSLWQSLEFTSNDRLWPTIEIFRHRRRVKITAHCKMEFDEHRMTSGSIELIAGRYTWNFTARLVSASKMEVTGVRVS